MYIFATPKVCQHKKITFYLPINIHLKFVNYKQKHASSIETKLRPIYQAIQKKFSLYLNLYIIRGCSVSENQTLEFIHPQSNEL